jgi:hypothetical protein
MLLFFAHLSFRFHLPLPSHIRQLLSVVVRFLKRWVSRKLCALQAVSIHHRIVIHPIAKFLHHNLTAFDAAGWCSTSDLRILILLFDSPPLGRYRKILRLWASSLLAESWPFWGIALKAAILPQGTVWRKLIASSSSRILLSCFSLHRYHSGNHQISPARSRMRDVISRVCFFLATVAMSSVFRSFVLRAIHRALGAINDEF